MTEIPEDVMKLAEDAYLKAIYMTAKDEPKAMVNMVARAILAAQEAQRERDAKIADNLAIAEHRLEADENIRAHHVRGVYAGNFLSWAHSLKADAAANVAAAIRTPA